MERVHSYNPGARTGPFGLVAIHRDYWHNTLYNVKFSGLRPMYVHVTTTYNSRSFTYSISQYSLLFWSLIMEKPSLGFVIFVTMEIMCM